MEKLLWVLLLINIVLWLILPVKSDPEVGRLISIEYCRTSAGLQQWANVQVHGHVVKLQISGEEAAALLATTPPVKVTIP